MYIQLFMQVAFCGTQHVLEQSEIFYLVKFRHNFGFLLKNWQHWYKMNDMYYCLEYFGTANAAPTS